MLQNYHMPYTECFALQLEWSSNQQVPKLSNGPDGNLAEGMLTDVITQGFEESLHTVAMFLRVLRDHGNDGAHQLLSHVAPCLHTHAQRVGRRKETGILTQKYNKHLNNRVKPTRNIHTYMYMILEA